ncbi:MAG TPA: serine/threonine-protein kinase [Terriglobales bacterium]|nr:serine/threonine-protein kinase [Terriglobales bacterium]
MASLPKSNRWLRIEYLFYAALELEEGRTAFLDEACGGDAELRKEVESLLHSSGQTMGFLRQPVLQAAQQITAEDGLSAKRIGAYQLLRVIGEGGMGKVYLAARADDLYQKEVAIKTVQGGLGQNRAMLLRFRSERQILANLDHPNIARLLDGGITEDGLPYLVMEYVNGVRLDDYCRVNKLATEQRLQLFCTVCAAVDYAHKNLVVHRDIKPANILVTAEGVPKLLDFGIAKLLNPESGDLAKTLTSERMMTPEYASPEQVRGDQVTTSTDVYALGVLLYELLAGRRPFQLATTSPFEMARIICEQEPELPSVVSTANSELAPPDAARTLSGDLDNIVLMAMRKEPARRYVSVAALADDVKAYLAGYPIHARTATWKYRSAKFVRRHKAAAAAAAIVALALIGFSVGMGLLAKRATRERLTAQRESQFLAGIFEAATPDQARGRQITARELLDQGAKRVDRELAGDPGLQGTMLNNIGRAYIALGLYDQATPLLERAYALRKKSLGEENADVADTLFQLADSIRLQTQYTKAEPLFRQALSIREKILPKNSPAVLESLGALGECLYLENRDAEAEPVLRRSVALDRELNSDTSRGYLALLLERKGEYPEALRLLRESVDYQRRINGADSPTFALSLHNLAGALIDAGDLAGAEATERQSLALQRKLLGEDHPDLAYPLNNLGFLLLEEGKWEEAEPVLRENREIVSKALGEKSARYAAALNNWARMLQQKGDYDQAGRIFNQALEIITQANGAAGWSTAKVTENLGLLQFDRGDYAGAEAYARRAFEIVHKLGGEENPQAAALLIDIAEDRAFQGDPASAEPLLRQALAIREKEFSPGHPNVIATEVRLGEVLTAEGKAAEAEPVLRDALASARSAPFPLLPWQIAEAQSALGACLVALNRAPEGEQLLKTSQTDLRKDPHPAFRQPRLLAAKLSNVGNRP